MFLNDKKNKVEQDTILLLFNAINKYGDRNMNQELVMFLDKKRYINILCLKEKTRRENNFIKFMNIHKKSSNKPETNRGSVLTFDGEKEGNLDNNTDSKNIKEEKINQNINRKIIEFYIYSYCSPNANKNKNVDIDLKDKNLINLDLDIENQENNDNNNSCGEPLIFNIKDLFHYESSKKYIELQCQKCHKIQNVTIFAYYVDENNNKKYQLNFNLISPLALLKEEWFINNNTLDPLFISKEYPEEYLSSLFYFYEQGLPCNFLIPRVTTPKILQKELNTTYNNIDPIEDYKKAKLINHKKSFSSLYSPRFRKRDINLSEKIDIFNMTKDMIGDGKEKTNGRKSPSPKKSSLMKRSKFYQKLRNSEMINYNKSTNLNTSPHKVNSVTFSLFKK